ncbi:MAG: hypothetical protein AAB291_01705, partial [Chloroflexota bacterium]
TPFLARKGEEIVFGGHPQTPGKGAKPLCTPLFRSLLIPPRLRPPRGIKPGAEVKRTNSTRWRAGG